jgi:oligoendopeptidase F
MKIEKASRTFVSQDLNPENWSDLEGLYSDLINRDLNDSSSLEKWLADKSELDAVLEENMAWRYIKMTIDTRNEELSKSYSHFIQHLSPEIAKQEDVLNQKLMAAPGVAELEKQAAYKIYFQSVRNSIQLFRKENIPLSTEIQEKAKEYGGIMAKQTIEWEGETLTMQQASTKLKEQDENIRKGIFVSMTERRAEDAERLNALFSEIVQLRHQVAVNAGFENFRDYKFVAMDRQDYTKEDCFDFHLAIEKCIVPLAKEIQARHCADMKETPIKPWNTAVDPQGKSALKPFEKGDELQNKTLSIFEKLDPYFASCLQTMDEMGHLDLDSKQGKSPGGYNYPLYEIGVPFIFMNAAGAHRDVVTMIHEGGHAVHSFLSRELKLTAFKNLPSEVAELASMSMELLSMGDWDQFYQNEDDLNRSKREHLEDILKVLPWVATIDAFQHWIYENPNHSIEERTTFWNSLNTRFGNPFVDWTEFEESRNNTWHRQLHLFEVPFYYIEYGIAQLGALGVYKNYKEAPEKAISDYKAALALGYTVPIPEIYKTANISFDFSERNIEDLANFLNEELTGIN